MKFSIFNSQFSIPNSGFTLMEILVYIWVLAIILVALSSFLIWAVRSNTKAKVMSETLNNTQRVMRIMTYEIKEAKDVYTPTSVFDSHPGQLSLQTTKYLPEGEKMSYVDFYLCDSQLCFKKESQDPVVLTSDNLEINNLVFSQVITGDVPSIQINFKADFKNPTNRPEYQASVNLTSTISLRNY